jgi:serine/threonine protein phosphatase PrpC
VHCADAARGEDVDIEAYARTDAGPVREQNEDSMLVDHEGGVFIVADGMGGHAAGEIASALAVRTVHKILVGHEDPDETRLVRDVDQVDTADLLRERLRYAMNQASVVIRKESESRPDTRGMGTTVVVLVIEGEQAHLAHVGDSRAYLWRAGRLMRLTRDHTVVQQEIDAGRLTPELARLVPHKHILTQSVGYHGPVEPDTATRWLEKGDLFILCSDGVTDPLDDDAITAVLEKSPQDLVAEALVDAALKAGGEDNVTVVAVAVR